MTDEIEKVCVTCKYFKPTYYDPICTNYRTKRITYDKVYGTKHIERTVGEAVKLCDHWHWEPKTFYQNHSHHISPIITTVAFLLLFAWFICV